MEAAAGTSGSSVSANEHLGTYLNDHLAGSMVGIELAKRAASHNEGTPLGEFLQRLASEIEADRETLRKLIVELDVPLNRIKIGSGWVGEKFSRMKMNGQIVGYSPLSRFIELETLYLGVTGKLELWRALERTLGDRVPGFDFAQLGRRAARQTEEIEEHRLEAADAALDPES